MDKSTPEERQDQEPNQTESSKAKTNKREDAKRGEVLLYAFGNIEASIADQFFGILNSILIVAMHVSPLLIGLILGIKTLWDSVTDPVMAYVTDNTRSRWGRRRPYILVGGVSRIALLLLICAFMPTGGHLSSNAVMEGQKFTNEAVGEAKSAHKTTVMTFNQIDTAEPDIKEKMLNMLEKTEITAQEAFQKVANNHETLQKDLEERKLDLEQKQLSLANAEKEYANSPDFEKELIIPKGLLEASEEKLAKAEGLINKARESQRNAIAAEISAHYILETHRPTSDSDPGTPEQAQEKADAAYAAAGLEPMSIFTIEKKPPPVAGKRKGMWANMKEGFGAFNDPKNFEQRKLIIYILFAVLLFTTFTTVQSVPYYALGIELCPSYDGRTRVVTYRAVMNKVAGLIQPWVPVFCFSLLFTTALKGLFWVAVIASIIGIPSTIIMCWFVKERTEISTTKKPQEKFFRSMWQVMHNRHFFKIFLLYWFLGLTNGIFIQVGFFLNVYWVMGSALSGAKLGAGVGMLAWGLGLINLPLINWGCRRFQKHKVLRFAIIWMSIGTALKWWCMNPEHPEYQFILPFFFSVGISSVYTVLPTMMADVTDVDELNHGLRREGMFGAVMAFLMKMIGTFTPIIAGIVLVAAGLDPALEYEQAPETILRMRLMYSFIPAGMLLFALAILWRYPLTRERVMEIKDKLHHRHEVEDAENLESES